VWSYLKRLSEMPDILLLFGFHARQQNASRVLAIV